MKATLLHFTPLNVCSHGIRTCWQSYERGDDGGPKDVELIERVGNKLKHSSTLEHLSYNFYIQGISRACLQELARHRIASLSVKSTRYTLKELKNEEPFTSLENGAKYLVYTGCEAVDEASLKALEALRKILLNNTSLDIAKYCLPESYKSELTWSINARSLQNFFTLRSSTHALKEIRELSFTLFKALPEEHRFIFSKCFE